MASRLKVHPYLNSEALEARYRHAQDVVELSQWPMLWLLSVGKTSSEVAAVTGYCVDWIRKLVRRYNAGGLVAVGDGRHHNPGQPRLLSAEQDAELLAELAKAVAAGQAVGRAYVGGGGEGQLGGPRFEKNRFGNL